MTGSFFDRLARRELVVGVVGLGYVGLPLAITFAEAGFRTVGVDVDAERIATLQRGLSPVEDITDERVQTALGSGAFLPSSTASSLADVDAVFIAVPTPFDASKTPDLTFIRSATEALAGVLTSGTLVVLQSTTYPGTTTEVVQPMLELTGLRAGVDFHLAFSPERVDPGNAVWNVANTPKIVGGLTEECSRRASALLDAVMQDRGLVQVVSSPAAAEMTKLLENTYRAVNIALVNELAMLSHEMGLDIWEVVGAASSKPFGFQAFMPGVGPGGHCIPVDPYYLSWRARAFDFQTKFIELAADTNLRMAPYVVGRIQAQLNGIGRALRGSTILVLGAAFKGGVGDTRNSRAIRVMELLDDAGASVEFADPCVDVIRVGGRERKPVDLTQERAASADLIAMLVPHAEWPIKLILDTGTPIFDAVNATAGQGGSHVERL